MEYKIISLIDFIFLKQTNFNNKSLFNGYSDLYRYIMKEKVNNPFYNYASEKSILQSLYNILKGKSDIKTKKEILKIVFINKMKEINVISENNVNYLNFIINIHEGFFQKSKRDKLNFLELYEEDNIKKVYIDNSFKKNTIHSQNKEEKKEIILKKKKYLKKDVRVNIDQNEIRKKQNGGYSETEYLNAMDIAFSKYEIVNPETITRVLKFMRDF